MSQIYLRHLYNYTQIGSHSQCFVQQIDILIYLTMKEQEEDGTNTITIPEVQGMVAEEIPKKKKVLAKANSEFDLNWANALNDLQGTKEEKEQILRKRLVRYFSYGQKLKVQGGYFEKRREPDYSKQDTKTLENEVILFGIDLLSFKRLKSVFKVDNIVSIDDSHAKLIFKTAADAYSTLKENAKNQKEFDLKVEEEVDVPKGWIELKPYYELNIERQIFARYATTLEQSIQPGAELINTLYRRAKQIFQTGMREQEQLFLNSRQRERKNQNYQTNERERSRQNKGRRHPYRNQESDFEFKQNQTQRRERDKNLSFDFGKEISQHGSNLSFIQNKSIKSKDGLSELNHAINDIHLSDKSSHFADQDPNMSINQNPLNLQNNVGMDVQNKNNSILEEQNSISRLKSNQADQNLSFEVPDRSVKSKSDNQSVNQSFNQSFSKKRQDKACSSFNYKQYVEETERKQRQKKIPVIYVDQD